MWTLLICWIQPEIPRGLMKTRGILKNIREMLLAKHQKIEIGKKMVINVQKGHYLKLFKIMKQKEKIR